MSHPHLFCRNVNCRLVVKRRDSLRPLSCQLWIPHRGCGPKSVAPCAWHRRYCFGEGGEQEAAEPRPGPAGSTAQHLHDTRQSRTHLETSGVCEQGGPVPVQALNSSVATRPLGSRRNGAQRQVCEYSRERVQKGLCAHWPVGENAGATTWQLNQSSRPEAERTRLNSTPYTTVRYCREQDQSVNNSWVF